MQLTLREVAVVHLRQGLTGERPATEQGCMVVSLARSVAQNTGERPVPGYPSHDDVALGLRLSNAMASAVYGPRGEWRG